MRWPPQNHGIITDSYWQRLAKLLENTSVLKVWVDCFGSRMSQVRILSPRPPFPTCLVFPSAALGPAQRARDSVRRRGPHASRSTVTARRQISSSMLVRGDDKRRCKPGSTPTTDRHAGSWAGMTRRLFTRRRGGAAMLRPRIVRSSTHNLQSRGLACMTRHVPASFVPSRDPIPLSTPGVAKLNVGRSQAQARLRSPPPSSA